MKPKAYSYIRFSSPEQARGNSYKRQREAAERYCEENGLELASTNEYTFFDAGRSAFKGKQVDDSGELGRFLKYVEDGVIEPGSYLLVESLDRLSREKVRDALPRFLDLLARGINVYTSADKRLYTKDFNEIDLILSIVSMSRAHEESSLKGMRVAKAWRNKQDLARTAKKPLGAACPYWLQLAKGVYVPVKERVDVIRRIFDMTIHGYGQAAISRRLNEDGVPVFGSTFETKPKPRNKSGAWGTSSVQKILNNRAVLGEYQPTYLQDGVRTNEGDAVEGFFPEVITPDVFLLAKAARIQRKTTRATKQSKNFNIWQGLAKCRLCGDAMHLINKGRPPKGYTYLQCYSAKKGKCRSGSIRIEQTEAVFKEILTKVDSMSLVQGRAAGILKGLQIAEGQLAAITDKLNKADEAHRESPSKRSGRLVQELELELEQLEKDRDELRQQITSSRVISREDFFQKLDLVTYEGRAAANSLLKRLGIEVQFKRQNPSNFRCWALDKSNEEAAQESDQILFGILYEDGTLTVQALDNDVFIRQIEQGEITAEDVNRDYEGGIDGQWFGTVFGKKK